ncbi:hypothetical protein [Pedobacter soli]|uniref:Uncharacterized protein n=1 Tax=Pedobacter soli TaxID=390242 RepID=A0A1G6WMS3_9SPHI|nr:hypothetical protein [Pedobacter soli]SDD66335.1 hypothetical protein SAMN04488024_10749 [Pedobacter soli]
MKPLTDLSGSEKARLLHELFPKEIPLLLADIKMFCESFKQNKEVFRSQWGDGFMSFDYWQNHSEETAGILRKHTFNMTRSSKVFSDQLYFTYTSLFVTDRIIKYAEHQSKDEKFKLIVQVLFT